jgi:hypothetical protein
MHFSAVTEILIKHMSTLFSLITKSYEEELNFLHGEDEKMDNNDDNDEHPMWVKLKDVGFA